MIRLQRPTRRLESLQPSTTSLQRLGLSRVHLVDLERSSLPASLPLCTLRRRIGVDGLECDLCVHCTLLVLQKLLTLLLKLELPQCLRLDLLAVVEVC